METLAGFFELTRCDVLTCLSLILCSDSMFGGNVSGPKEVCGRRQAAKITGWWFKTWLFMTFHLLGIIKPPTR
jgi:hypothetical protein